MQRLEVTVAARPLYWSLGVKGLKITKLSFMQYLPILLLLSALSILCSDTPSHCHPTGDANFHLSRIYCFNSVYFHVWVFTYGVG